MPPDATQEAVNAVEKTFSGTEKQTDFDALTKRAADSPEPWKPEPGDMLTGRVEGPVTNGESQYGLYPIVEIRDLGGNLWVVHAFHTVLRNSVDQLNLQPGEAVSIKYFGREPAKTEGNDDTYMYRVVVDR
jgi:hypothetical protein